MRSFHSVTKYTDLVDSTPFSRRLSLKLKNLPGPIKSSTKPDQEVSKPVDSIYSTDRKRSTSSPTNFTTDTEQTEPDPAPESEKYGHVTDPEQKSTKFSLARDPSQPGSKLAIFPKVMSPSQSAAPSRNITPLSATKPWEAELYDSKEMQPAAQQHVPKSSRSFSVSKFFHKKGESRSVSASQSPSFRVL